MTKTQVNKVGRKIRKFKVKAEISNEDLLKNYKTIELHSEGHADPKKFGQYIPTNLDRIKP
jgi:hypothetical protein